MKALEVFINGHRLCLAGVGKNGVLSTIVNWTSTDNLGIHDCDMSVGGMDCDTGEHLHWNVPSIGVGTEVLVRIVEAENVDPPDRGVSPRGQSAVEEVREHFGDLVERTTEEERKVLLRELIQQLERP